MSYQVLARKWRPRTFAEMAGQEHVLRALINALDNDRLHHAYLFTGTRGVGKTTIARILAKCLNCEQGVGATACGECSACNEITDGRFIDLIEVDAASRTKVEDTRELLDNVQYMPTRGRYKVYLIDEVHMLSTHSFNALLKTLEEPPPHVKFLLATTDPQKLPVTILSRCLQFNLKNLSPEPIVEYLKHVLSAEQVPVEEAALWALARAADGSMRDALSLTDQAIAHGGGKLAEVEVNTMLGTINRTTVLDICRKIAERDAPGVLALVDALAEHAPDYSSALGDMLAIWHRVALAQAVPSAIDNSLGDQQSIVALAETLSREDVQLFYQICLIGRRDLSLAADARSGLEMVLLRKLAFQPELNERVEPPAIVAGEAGGVPTTSEQGGVEAGKKPEAGVANAGTIAAASAVASDAGTPLGTVAQDTTQHRPADVDATPPMASTQLAAPGRSAQRDQLSEPTIDQARAGSVAKIPNLPTAVDAFSAQQWLVVCEQLGLQGRLFNIASNLAFVGQETARGETVPRFHFKLDEAHSALYDEVHQQQLGEALQDYLKMAVTVSIDIAPVTVETPYLYRLRLRAERQAEAVQALREDPLVRELQQRFGGELLEDTVVPTD